ncbi:transposase [Cohnella sp. GCM10012308]|uniref:transposase n=1 Tax=Cohnella sp. GCM10012308 TaxID=3317329 RepID=UPI003606AE04
MSDNNEMLPLSGEKVESDGIYRDEWGRELKLERGNEFPSDPDVGSTEWEWVEAVYDNHHDGETDPRLVPKEKDINKQEKIEHPRRQVDRGSKG